MCKCAETSRVCARMRVWLASVTAVIWPADSDAPSGPMADRGRQQGEGRASGADSIWRCRAWFGGGRFRSGHQCHLRSRRGERLFKWGGVTSALEWPQKPSAAAAAQRGGDAVYAHGQKQITKPDQTQRWLRTTFGLWWIFRGPNHKIPDTLDFKISLKS